MHRHNSCGMLRRKAARCCQHLWCTAVTASMQTQQAAGCHSRRQLQAPPLLPQLSLLMPWHQDQPCSQASDAARLAAPPSAEALQAAPVEIPPDVSLAPWLADSRATALAAHAAGAAAAAGSPQPAGVGGPDTALPEQAVLDELASLPAVPVQQLHVATRQAVPAGPVAEAAEGVDEDLDQQMAVVDRELPAAQSSGPPPPLQQPRAGAGSTRLHMLVGSQ